MNLNNFNRNLEFVWYRAMAEIKSDMSKGFLGFLWWIVEPLVYMSVFYVIFGVVFKQKDDNYIAFLLCGLIVWKWFDSSIRNACLSIQLSKGLIYQVYLPKYVFPLISIVISSTRFCMVFTLFISFLCIKGYSPPLLPWLFDLPLLFLLQIMLMIGIGITVAAVTPFIPDIKLLIDNGMTLLFFLSGIFFRFENMPKFLLPYFKWNPIGMLIRNFREVILKGNSVDWVNMIPAILITLMFLIIGFYMLKRMDRSYAKRAFI